MLHIYLNMPHIVQPLICSNMPHIVKPLICWNMPCMVKLLTNMQQHASYCSVTNKLQYIYIKFGNQYQMKYNNV